MGRLALPKGETHVKMARVLAVVLVVAVAVLASPLARADELTVAGVSSSNPPSGITFLPGSFSGLTSGGFAAFSNLGSYSLSSTPATYSGVVNLQIAFTLPTGIAGGNSTTFVASLFGNVTTDPISGGVSIVFTNASQTFTFSNASGSGTFTFTVNNVSINPGGTTTLSGFVSNASFTPVPEASTVLLLGAGLLLVPFLGLKRSS
jgi:hypothetical protein